ncbi:metallophosphoesterase [Candidatus Endolissoclinum faulkneri L5]|uniref:Metallophosphoesterase n=1 Tax=Candidatus Endolissoclinum faulkneri L5 TaxID=1401328 RepID=V9TTL6_9PROT|nr:TIGR00282 family metallophosphoesterase [Candidatus Endolissoclinum faulkneri]AHC73512.1 metallophosphoesterase [Candidatus Endolissoclinum faulkneri L5]
MRVLFLGDIVGRVGREAVIHHLPNLIKFLKIDFVVANGENSAHGFGITSKICNELYDSGVDVITTGNHVWDQREIINFIVDDDRLVRPINFPRGTPGKGAVVRESCDGHRVLVINVMCRLFMEPLDDPFIAVEKAIDGISLGGELDFILIDVHGEATSEKMAFGHAFDGRVSLVVGTHTHVPTADLMVLANGTAYQSDVGMCGDYDSVIGMKKEYPIKRFITKLPTPRLEAAEGEATICGILVVTDDRSGLAISAEPLRVGGLLTEIMPLRS